MDDRARHGQGGHFNLAQEQAPQPNRDIQLLDLGGILAARPGRAADAEPAHAGRRGPAEQPDIEVAVQQDLATRRGGRRATDRAANPVPVEQNQEQQTAKRHGQGDPRRDDLRLAGLTERQPGRVFGDHIGPEAIRPVFHQTPCGGPAGTDGLKE
ncbi:hypothetical protein D3C80_871740 [compost metagenome]